MEKLSEKQSLEIITQMINDTKSRLHIGDGNIMLLWGYLTVAVTALVWIMVTTFHHPAYNFLFFLIWIIGGIVSPKMERKQETGVKTYVDKITSGIWQIVGYSAIATTLICLAFFFLGGKNCWEAMTIFALVIIGFAVAIQGIIVKEKAMTICGGIGLFIGLIVTAALVDNTRLYTQWFCPMFMVAFTAMLIIPGHILNYKARRVCSKS